MNAKAARKYLFAALVCAGAVAAYRTFGWGGMEPVNSLGLDLSSPDALVLSHSMSSLPRDLLSIPLARDVLREDIVFYYEQNEDRLGLKGALRRIAYEHELTWGDELIRMVLDQPAELALWRDGDGTLKHFAIAVTRTRLARLLEESAKVALKDTQMRLAGELRVGSNTAPVYALDYVHGRTLLFVAHGERMVILSHPGMLYGGRNDDHLDDRLDARARDVVVKLLAPDARANGVLREGFQLESGIPAGHSVAIKADFLSFGYQPFFGALQALRFDFSRDGWQSQVLLDGAALKQGGYDSRPLWDTLPYGASACFSVPADWAAMGPVLKRLDADAAVDTLAAQFAGPAAACWYGASHLYTPVFVARRAPAAAGAGAAGDRDAALAGLFNAMVGPSEGASDTGAGKRWQRTRATPAGALTPTLATSGDAVVFSADPALVDGVLAVHQKRAAAASDRLPAPARTVGIINPAALAQLMRKEAADVLPPGSEPVLRAAFDTHMTPRLDALARYPAYRMVLGPLPASGKAWTRLEWQAIR